MDSSDYMNQMFQEELWEGKFGSDYLERNPTHIPERGQFWSSLIADLEPGMILEVGCGSGINLHHLNAFTFPWAIEINQDALQIARDNIPEANIVYGSIYDIPFKDNFFDLVFTCGVLIHQPPKLVHRAVEEMIRCTQKWVLAIEYHSEEFVEIEYRGQKDSLWKGPYDVILQEHGLNLQRAGLLRKSTGFDNCMWWLLEK